MTKPPSSVRSIRLADEAWAWLSAHAAEGETTVNALVAGLVDLARKPPNIAELRAIAAAMPPLPPAEPTATAIRVAGPQLLERKRFNPQPKPKKR